MQKSTGFTSFLDQNIFWFYQSYRSDTWGQDGVSRLMARKWRENLRFCGLLVALQGGTGEGRCRKDVRAVRPLASPAAAQGGDPLEIPPMGTRRRGEALPLADAQGPLCGCAQGHAAAPPAAHGCAHPQGGPAHGRRKASRPCVAYPYKDSKGDHTLWPSEAKEKRRPSARLCGGYPLRSGPRRVRTTLATGSRRWLKASGALPEKWSGSVEHMMSTVRRAPRSKKGLA